MRRVDDENLYLATSRLQLESQLLAQRCGQCRAIRQGRRCRFRPQAWKLFKLDAQVHVEETRKPSSVDNRTTG